MQQFTSKKIFFLTENYERGGGNRYLYDLASIAKSQGHSVTVFSNHFGLEPQEVQWFEDLKITYRPISFMSWGELRARYKLRNNFIFKLLCRIVFLILCPLSWIFQFLLFRKILQNEKPDLIVGANGGYPGGGAVNRFILIGHLLKIPSFNSIVNIPSQEFLDQIRMLFWDQVIPYINRKIIVDSQEIIRQLKPHGFSKEKCSLVYNGLPGTLPYQPRNNTKVRILFFARLELIKGADVFIESIRRLIPLHKNLLEVHIYGSGSFSETMKKLAAEFPGKVSYFGFIEGDFQQIFSEADVYVLPSTMEGLPYTVLEAMRSGCCVVSTKVGGLPELIQDGFSGILIHPQNPSQLTSTLTTLIQNPIRREQLGRAAKARFDAEFEQGSIFAKHATLFDD